MDEHAAQPAGPCHLGRRGGSPATAATVRLATAARALGISQAAAEDLAERGEFACNVIKTSDGYRVPFAALLRLLRSGCGEHTGPGPGNGTPADQERQEHRVRARTRPGQ